MEQRYGTQDARRKSVITCFVVDIYYVCSFFDRPVVNIAEHVCPRLLIDVLRDFCASTLTRITICSVLQSKFHRFMENHDSLEVTPVCLNR